MCAELWFFSFWHGESVRRSKKEPSHIPLTKREQEVMDHVVKGVVTIKIAGLLGITYQTVRTHKKNIYKKLRVNSLVEAVAVYKNTKS